MEDWALEQEPVQDLQNWNSEQELWNWESFWNSEQDCFVWHDLLVSGSRFDRISKEVLTIRARDNKKRRQKTQSEEDGTRKITSEVFV